MSGTEELKVCPECQTPLPEREEYEGYLYCNECGWDEINGADTSVIDTPDLNEDDTIFTLEEDEDIIDTNFDPEAGEDA